jgi:hypothetical protein
MESEPRYTRDATDALLGFCAESRTLTGIESVCHVTRYVSYGWWKQITLGSTMTPGMRSLTIADIIPHISTEKLGEIWRQDLPVI